MKGISVSGTGIATAAPDVVSVELGAEAVAGSAAEARRAASEAAQRMIDALKAKGVASSDIQTSRVSIQPQHDYPSGSPPRLIGYLASNMVRAQLRDTEAAGAVLDNALEAGGDAARMHGFRLAFSKPEALAADARARAVEAARANAETLARAAGVKLGRVLAISEVEAGAPQPRMMAMALEKGASTPIETGESSVAISVLVRFAIKP